MGQVSEWLQKIIAAVILAGFLEMLLPNNELKSVTKMVMGLLIMMILVQPLIKILDLQQRVSWNLPVVSELKSSQATQAVIQRGLKIQKSWAIRFEEQNKNELTRRIKNILGLMDEVQLEDVKLDFQDGRPVKAIVKLKPQKSWTANPGVPKKIRDQVINSVQLLTNLPEKRIEVVNLDGGS